MSEPRITNDPSRYNKGWVIQTDDPRFYLDDVFRRTVLRSARIYDDTEKGDVNLEEGEKWVEVEIRVIKTEG